MVKGWCFWGLDFLEVFFGETFTKSVFDGRVEMMLLRVITFQKCQK